MNMPNDPRRNAAEPNSKQPEPKGSHNEAASEGRPEDLHRPTASPPGSDASWPTSGPGSVSPAANSPVKTPQEWGEIDDFEKTNLPPFPVDALPEVLRDFVTELAIETQTPPDMAAMLSLAVCAAAIARKVEIHPRGGWMEPSNLFVVIIMGPANRKSQVLRKVAAPLVAREDHLIAAKRESIASEHTKRRQLEARLKSLEKVAGESPNNNKRDKAALDAKELAIQLSSTPIPVSPRLIADNITEEKLEQMLLDHGERIACFSAEGGIFDIMKGKYSSAGPQFDGFLKAHAGDRIVTDRMGRASVVVERPALTCAYAVQPQVMKAITGDDAFRGRGLMARFLYASPESLVGRRDVAAPAMSLEVAESYAACVERMASFDGELELRFSLDADIRLRKWESEVEEMLDVGGDLEYMQDWGGKLAGATVRLAGIIECVDSTFDESLLVGIRSLERAIQIARYAISHADAVLERPDSPSYDDAQYLWRWLRKKELRVFRRRDVYQALKRRFPEVKHIAPALSELCERNFLRVLPKVTGKIGAPPMEYEVNPCLLDGATRPQKSQNSVSSLSEGFEDVSNGGESEDWGAP
ncbi:hypothetical protein Pla123a_46040 [Posidoniimonas polymericola]|uniref:DUF3987 domain-containing protein n=1 Tax=Posidoniimonas polymericola TaxID=2528002 RepID=A0A5C5XVK6_9BACT|nr:YfjI family protein [Posidoniimonas polymericola]TWT66718.1 hypothetical protein Pla123a_46040 [Posidoniimonas polymericola]